MHILHKSEWPYISTDRFPTRLMPRSWKFINLFWEIGQKKPWYKSIVNVSSCGHCLCLPSWLTDIGYWVDIIPTFMWICWVFWVECYSSQIKPWFQADLTVTVFIFRILLSGLLWTLELIARGSSRFNTVSAFLFMSYSGHLGGPGVMPFKMQRFNS